jgi:hypothetical protein
LLPNEEVRHIERLIQEGQLLSRGSQLVIDAGVAEVNARAIMVVTHDRIAGAEGDQSVAEPLAVAGVFDPPS